MSIHIPENTDISGFGRAPRSVGMTRARRNKVFTVLDFIPPERRCRNGEIVPAWDKCLEDYQISPPGQARKAEYGMGGLSKSLISKLKASIVRQTVKPTPAKLVSVVPVAPLVGSERYPGSPNYQGPPGAPLVGKKEAACKNSGGMWLPCKGLGYEDCGTCKPNPWIAQKPVAPLITKPVTTDGHVVTQAEVDASSKNNCEIGGGTWVPTKRTRFGWGRGSRIVKAHCQPKVVAPTGSGKQGMLAKLQAAIAAAKARELAAKESNNAAKLNCELSGGTWVPAKTMQLKCRGCGSRKIAAHCQPKTKLSDCGCGE